jgi:hypothetical protein
LLALAFAFLAVGIGGFYSLKQAGGSQVEPGLTLALTSAPAEENRSAQSGSVPLERSSVFKGNVVPRGDEPASLSAADYLRTFPFDGESGHEEFDYEDPETLARRFGRATLQQAFVLEDDGEAADMLRRFRSVASVASARGIELTEQELRAIEISVVPKYEEQIEPLARVAVSEINRCIYDMYDRGGYQLTSPDGRATPSGTAELPDGEFKKSCVFDVVGGYSVRFDFNSAAYPDLDALLVSIGDLKLGMEREVLGLIE